MKIHRVRKDRMTKAEEAKLNNLTAGYLLKLGAVRDPSNDLAGCWEAYSLPTPFGMLRVQPSGHNLFCQFDEPLRARALECNPYSGKYNAHVFARMTAAEAFEAVHRPHLDRAMRA